ncbi:zinc finger protein 883-like [Anopheles cruzii]|uniref:zinc finger protein 883-like n=1 Tax=Anopheles cruzii TaxID=68878 RepID=UPI0022EC4E05|nr:zinc finger protein 883-like [Anopheles cruzii]
MLNDQQIYEWPRKKHSPQEPIDGEILQEDVELGKELEPATEVVKEINIETNAELNVAVVRKRGNTGAKKRHHTRTSARRCFKNRDEGSSQLRCRKCKFVAASSESFQLHTENHQKLPKPVLCKRCNLKFDSQKELKSHKHSEHRDYICDSCGMSFAVKFSLDEHRKRHEPVRPYKCEYCPLEYYTKAEKHFHVRQVHLKTYEVKCKECGLRFKHNAELKQHSKSHTNQRWYECAQCGSSFKSHTHLNRHVKGVHELQRHQCEHCSMSYCRRDKLRMHIEKKHNIQMYFVCDICLQSYNTSKQLNEHKNHHQNPKDQQCGLCLGAFLTTKEFSDHLCITYRENYICCTRDFKYHYFYNKHMFLVHGQHTNVRVKPAEGMLTGQFRALRSQEKWCPICEQLIPAWCTKKQHIAKCGTTVHKTEYVENASLETTRKTNDNTLEISIIGPRANNN